jgi:hypothetical protein
VFLVPSVVASYSFPEGSKELRTVLELVVSFSRRAAARQAVLDKNG